MCGQDARCKEMGCLSLFLFLLLHGPLLASFLPFLPFSLLQQRRTYSSRNNNNSNTNNLSLSLSIPSRRLLQKLMSCSILLLASACPLSLPQLSHACNSGAVPGAGKRESFSCCEATLASFASSVTCCSCAVVVLPQCFYRTFASDPSFSFL